VYGPTIDRDIKKSSLIMFLDSRGNLPGVTPYGACSNAGFWNFGAQGMIAHMDDSGVYGFFDGHAECITWSNMFGRQYDPSLGSNWADQLDNNLIAAGRVADYSVSGFDLWCGWE
jgi:hypothetical protein